MLGPHRSGMAENQYDDLYTRLAAVRDERDCYRQALEEIAAYEDDCIHRHQARAVLGISDRGMELVEGREGMLTVYDHRGRYRGCIGAASWDVLLAEGDAHFEALASGPESVGA